MLTRALARLYALAPRGARLGLDSMLEACAAEGNPQDSFQSIHVAGTNGKGSTCAMLASIARAAGLRTGLTTSPHLLRFAERIQIDATTIDDQLLAEQLNDVMDRYPSLTFFEVTTLVAFRAFRAAHVQLAIVEVGLGGRLDATNVMVQPLACVITSIGLDHTEWLGGTLAEIAREKAGIVKPKVPLYVGVLPTAAMQVIENVAHDVCAPMMRLGVDFSRRGNWPTPLMGAHQQDNTSLACEVVKRFVDLGVTHVSDEVIKHGLQTTDWPGRCEEIVVEDGLLAGRYLLDGAHNEQGAASLAQTLATIPGPKVCVFGAMADKDVSAMIDLLSSVTTMRIYTSPNAGQHRVAHSPDTLRSRDFQSVAAQSLDEALMVAREHAGDHLVVVCGSLYLVAQARAKMLGLPRDPHVGL